jgi:serine/threonine protein kinase
MQHPADEVIAQFVQGRLSLAEAARWETHLSSCEECGRRLGAVGADGLMQLLQHTPIKPLVDTLPMNLNPELPPEMRSHSRYHIERKLGHGGMGMVYQATHRLMHRPVALKMIRADLLATPLAITRFRREVQAAASLAHPNIVTAYDAEEVAGVHFLVMEYVEGRSLDELVRQKGPLAVPVVISVAKQIAQGLHHAHTQGMIHRDIKPSNVMITRTGKAKILDFGLARWSGRQGEQTLPNITATGTHLGTLMYASPEQLQSAGTVDARADLYSLGATLVFLLTGNPPPFALDQSSGPISWPSEVPDKLREIIEKLLEHQPDQRYASAKAVLEALNQVKEPASEPFRLQATKRLQYALLAAVGLVLVLGGLLIERMLRPATSPVALNQSTRPQPTVNDKVEQPARKTEEPQATKPVPHPTKPVEPAKMSDTWVSLMDAIDPDRDAVAGVWKKHQGELINYPGQGGRLAVPFEAVESYDLRVVFTRRQGINSVGAIVTMGKGRCTFELDAWGIHLSGFQNVNGNDLRHNDNPTRRENLGLENDRQYTLVLEVRPRSMRALLDNVEVSRYEGDGSDLMLDDKFWEMREGTRLGLLSWHSQTVFHQVQWRRR